MSTRTNRSPRVHALLAAAFAAALATAALVSCTPDAAPEREAAANGGGRMRQTGGRRGRKGGEQAVLDLDGTGPMCHDRGEAAGG